MESTYPACLQGKVEAVAREIHEARLAEGHPGSLLDDWLEAEVRVLQSHERSPARLMPGGDLFDLDAQGCWALGETGTSVNHSDQSEAS